MLLAQAAYCFQHRSQIKLQGKPVLWVVQFLKPRVDLL